jgi:predicted nucleic acid-binding Zn ribbon protein
MIRKDKCVVCGATYCADTNKITCSPACHEKFVKPPETMLVIDYGVTVPTLLADNYDEGVVL